ncbi:MAG: hypothetical protein AAF467_17580 [Actinomycetota bacterium]
MFRRSSFHGLTRPAGRFGAALAAGLTASLLVVIPAVAEDDLVINPQEVTRGNPGETVTVAQQAVPAELVGRVCDVRIESENGSSVHPGNVVITTTGGVSHETPGVEDGSGAKVIDVESVALGDTVTVQIRFGEDGVSSLGFSVLVDCPQLEILPNTQTRQRPDPTTTVQVTTSTTEAPSTSDTTAPAAPVSSDSTTSTPTADQTAPPATPNTGNPTFTG